jgi:hypothetical protein
VTRLALDSGVPLTPYTRTELRELFADRGFGSVMFQEWYAPPILLNRIALQTDETGRKMLQTFFSEPYALLLTAVRL